MQTVSLEDEVIVRLNDRLGGITLQCDDPSLATDHTNLVYRAAAAALERSGEQVGVDIQLKKRIPMGAGLGGGSSDAAATILAVGRLLHQTWTQEEMAQIGQALGSDVPFFFAAPAAIVKGRGELVKPVRLKGIRWVVLVNPGFPVETKWAYQRLSSLRTHVPPLSDGYAALEAASDFSWEHLAKTMENDFEAPVFDVHADLRRIKDDLLEAGAEAALLSGSGATVFGLFSGPAQAEVAATLFRDRRPLKVFVVPTASASL